MQRVVNNSNPQAVLGSGATGERVRLALRVAMRCVWGSLLALHLIPVWNLGSLLLRGVESERGLETELNLFLLLVSCAFFAAKLVDWRPFRVPMDTQRWLVAGVLVALLHAGVIEQAVPVVAEPPTSALSIGLVLGLVVLPALSRRVRRLLTGAFAGAVELRRYAGAYCEFSRTVVYLRSRWSRAFSLRGPPTLIAQGISSGSMVHVIARVGFPTGSCRS